MFKSLSFKQKIAIVISILSIGLATVSAVLIYSYQAQSQQAMGLTQSSRVTIKISDFIHELQKERAKSVLFLNKRIEKTELETQRKIVQEKSELMQKQISDFAISNVKQLEEEYDKHLQEIRESVNSEKKTAAEIAGLIGELINHWIKIETTYAQYFHFNGYESNLTSIAIFEKSKENMGRLRAALNSILASNTAVTSLQLSKLAEYVTGIITNLDSPGLNLSETSKKEIEKILSSDEWKKVLEIYSKVIEKSGTGEFGYDPKQYSETITKVIDNLRQVILSESIFGNTQIESAEKDIKIKFNIVLFTSLALLLISIFVSYIVVKEVNNTLLAVSSNITQSASDVEKISKFISKSSNQISSSIQSQAAALQETSSAIEQTSSTINKNAENTKKSSEITSKSQTEALDGKSAVDDMQNAMGEISESNQLILKQIEKSNQEISEIINVIKDIEEKTKIINDIVFQTKLLSFNASVEAARAGENGKGFSVVAEEISSLAELSGKASNEISELLDRSTKKVDEIVNNMIANVGSLTNRASEKIDNGQITAKRCGEVLQNIVGNVSHINDLVSEISVATEEQSRGVSEISKSMVELDTLAQQNNASAQESYQSALELEQQVEGLKMLVQKLNGVVNGAQQI